MQYLKRLLRIVFENRINMHQRGIGWTCLRQRPRETPAGSLGPRRRTHGTCLRRPRPWARSLYQLKNATTATGKQAHINCRVHKPGVPQGLASTPGLSLRKQHVSHGPAQESKKQRAERTVWSPTGRSTQKDELPLDNFFGPPLRTERSLRAPSASGRSLRSECLAKNATSYSDPVTPTGDP